MPANGRGPVASAHLFTYRSLRDAGHSLTRGRERLRRVPGLRFARLIFVGSRRSEAIGPALIDPRRQLAMCVWDEEQSLEQFLERSPVGRAWQQRTHHYCEIRATPFRSHGAYMGEEPLAGLPPGTAPDGPVALMTFANMPVRGMWHFYRGLHDATPPLHASPGLIASAGGPERFGRGAMTFTIWRSLPDALAYSYRGEPHRRLVKEIREGRGFVDSMFLRVAPYAAAGSWFPWSRFADSFEEFTRAMRSGPAPAPPATTPPGPAAPYPTG